MEKFVNEGFSTRQIAEKMNLSQTTVSYWLKKLNLKTKPSLGNKGKGKNRTPKVLDYDWKNIQEDHDAGMTWSELTLKYKLSLYLLSQAKKNNLFTSRNKSSSMKLAHDSGKYDYEIFKTAEFREKQRKFGGLKDRAGRCKKIKYANNKSVEFLLQGSWELKLAEFLNHRNIEWIKNTKYFRYCFEGKIRKYYPDFYLPDLDLYIEVKGYEIPRDKVKWDAFPNKLLICRKAEINNLDSFLKLNVDPGGIEPPTYPLSMDCYTA